LALDLWQLVKYVSPTYPWTALAVRAERIEGAPVEDEARGDDFVPSPADFVASPRRNSVNIAPSPPPNLQLANDLRPRAEAKSTE
jgi:hypothetical protein